MSVCEGCEGVWWVFISPPCRPTLWYSGAGRAVIWGTWLRTTAFPGKAMGRMWGGGGVLYVWVTRHGWAWGLCREAGWR